MKHYTPEKWREYELFRPRLRREVGCKPKRVAEVKTIYRQRERSVLKREVMREYEAHVHEHECEVERWTREAETAMAALIEIEACVDTERYCEMFARLHEAETNLSELTR